MLCIIVNTFLSLALRGIQTLIRRILFKNYYILSCFIEVNYTLPSTVLIGRILKT
jgi:hypothetical protein